MKLSICIPIYNTCAQSLINSLNNEIEKDELQSEVEIIVIDDASETEFRKKNRLLSKMCQYIELEKNIGRSKIRNRFIEYSKGDFLLFLDGDSLIRPISDHPFIFSYLKEIDIQTNCICGGRVYPKLSVIKGIELNYLYGIKKESKSLEERLKHPNRSFMTNNFLIRKSVFEKIRFDEQLTQYGHEDTLFGIHLLEKEITIRQIDNPVLNGHIETNEIFLQKSEQAIENLVIIYKQFEDKQLLISHVTILQWVKRLSVFPLRNILLIIFSLTKNRLRRNLIEGKINLRLFDFYKLGLFLRLEKKYFSKGFKNTITTIKSAPK